MLQKWSKEKFTNYKIQIAEIQAKIESLQESGNADHNEQEDQGLKARLADH